MGAIAFVRLRQLAVGLELDGAAMAGTLVLHGYSFSVGLGLT
jgi:hypothetical protein